LGNVPGSRYRAAQLGPDFMGWGTTEAVLANIFDLIVVAVEGKDLKEEHLYKRPVEDEDEQAATVADFNVDRFMRQLGQ
jgi:hypothetical protein